MNKNPRLMNMKLKVKIGKRKTLLLTAALLLTGGMASA